ncbi:hypothetical protein FB451DRAFT_1413911 [Mycena latifolia]|nr:hypothetical protein FB451DRAFT_1413911 [Mycena latifolia]
MVHFALMGLGPRKGMAVAFVLAFPPPVAAPSFVYCYSILTCVLRAPQYPVEMAEGAADTARTIHLYLVPHSRCHASLSVFQRCVLSASHRPVRTPPLKLARTSLKPPDAPLLSFSSGANVLSG